MWFTGDNSSLDYLAALYDLLLIVLVFAFSALMLLGGRKGIWPVKKTEWWDVGVVVCDEVQTCI